MFLRDILTVILAPLIDCHVPGRNVSGEPNIHSDSFNNAEQFSIDVSFKTVYSIVVKISSRLTCLCRACIFA